jgi:hypothetical protein
VTGSSTFDRPELDDSLSAELPIAPCLTAAVRSGKLLTMQVVTTDREGATVDLSYDELVLLFGALLEAVEALSAAEFRARLGRDETDADALRSALKPVILSVEQMRQADNE